MVLFEKRKQKSTSKIIFDVLSLFYFFKLINQPCLNYLMLVHLMELFALKCFEEVALEFVMGRALLKKFVQMDHLIP